MLYKTKNNCIFVVSHTARYDYAYSEVRGELVCRGAQTTDQDCEVRQYAGENHPASKYPSCGRQEWETAYDGARGCHCLQHIRHYSPERQDLLWGEGARRNHSAKETGDTASRGQGYRRHRGSYHSSRLRRSSQGICQVDASSSCRQVGQTGVYRIYISYAGRPHSKKTSTGLI